MTRNKRIHATKEICLKKALIDKEIIPLVNWLNSFHSIYTTYSCQGDVDHKNIGSSYPYVYPYVSFLCGDLDDLNVIKKHIKEVSSKFTNPEDIINLSSNMKSCNSEDLVSFNMWFSSRSAFKIMLYSIEVLNSKHKK